MHDTELAQEARTKGAKRQDKRHRNRYGMQMDNRSVALLSYLQAVRDAKLRAQSATKNRGKK